MKIAILSIILAAICLAGCSTSQLSKATAAVATISSDAGKLSSDEAKYEPVITAVTGSNAKVAGALSYAATIAQDAQTLGPLISDLIQLIPSNGQASARYQWTAKGLAALHRHHIAPNDPMALAKLARFQRHFYALSGGRNIIRDSVTRDAVIGCKSPSPAEYPLRARRAAQNLSLASN